MCRSNSLKRSFLSKAGDFLPCLVWGAVTRSPRLALVLVVPIQLCQFCPLLGVGLAEGGYYIL